MTTQQKIDQLICYRNNNRNTANCASGESLDYLKAQERPELNAPPERLSVFENSEYGDFMGAD